MNPADLEVECKALQAVEDRLLRFAVVVSRYGDEWVFSKHKARDTWEIPGGTREAGEAILDTARRELFEETGAVAYDLYAVCAYASSSGSHGLLCFAEITRLASLPASEIGCVGLFDGLPPKMTYKKAHPVLFARVKSWLAQGRPDF